MQKISNTNSAGSDFAAKVSRLGLSALTTSALAMLYKLAMPRVLEPAELARWYFAETFPYLFFSIVPLGMTTYIAREMAGNVVAVRQSLASILYFEAICGAFAYVALITFLVFVHHSSHQATILTATMAITCLALVLQQRIMRPTFIALNATTLVTRIEIIGKIIVSCAALSALWLHASLTFLASILAVCESGVLGALIWTSWRQGWLRANIKFLEIRKILKASLPFTGAAVILGINSNIDSSLFALLSNPYETGLFAAANRLGLIVLFGVSLLFSSVMPMLGQVSRLSPQSYSTIFMGVMRLICAFGLPLSLVFVLLAPLLTRGLLGKEYMAAAHALSIYGPFAIVVAFNTIASSNLALRSDGRRFLTAIVSSFVLNICTATVAITLAHAYFGPGAAATSRLIAGVLSELASSMLMLRFAHANADSRLLLRWLLCAVIPSLLVAVAQINSWSGPWPFLVGILILLPPFLVYIGMIQSNDRQTLLSFLREVFNRQQSTEVLKSSPNL